MLRRLNARGDGERGGCAIAIIAILFCIAFWAVIGRAIWLAL
jgi:hypothetical protein